MNATKSPSILLSFDVEEFDLPLEYGQHIASPEQIAIGYEGLKNIWPLLQLPDVRTTLFTTAFFAEQFPAEIKQLAQQHEIASHTYYHSSFTMEDLLLSRRKLEEISGSPVSGLRMPRMAKVPGGEVALAGYTYNSSINPCWLPGRYDNRHVSRTVFMDDGIPHIPVSVTPRLRIPLFWLAFKNVPLSFYFRWVMRTLRNDGYVCLYFHPWEFARIQQFAIPTYIKKSDPAALLDKLHRLVMQLKNEARFVTIRDFLKTNVSINKDVLC